MKIKSAEFVKSSAKHEECPKADRPEYAFIGRSNVGKSSLINALCNRNSLAKTSGTPGKTQLINHFLINDTWYLVDLPGYGFAKVSKKLRGEWDGFIKKYLKSRTNLVSVFVLIDSRHEPLKNDLQFMEWLGINRIPFTMVFTKIDKLSSGQLNKNLTKYKSKMLNTWEEVPQSFNTSSESKLGTDLVLNYVDKMNEALGGRFHTF